MSIISAGFSEMLIVYYILCLRVHPSKLKKALLFLFSEFVCSNHVKQKIKLFWRVGCVGLLVLETV